MDAAPEVRALEALNAPARYRSPGRRALRALLRGRFVVEMAESGRVDRQRAKVARRKPGRKWRRDELAKAARELA